MKNGFNLTFLAVHSASVRRRLWQQTWCCRDVTVRIDRGFDSGLHPAGDSVLLCQIHPAHCSTSMEINVHQLYMLTKKALVWGPGRFRFWCWSLCHWWLWELFWWQLLLKMHCVSAHDLWRWVGSTMLCHDVPLLKWEECWNKPISLCHGCHSWPSLNSSMTPLGALPRREVQGPYEKAAALAAEMLFAIRTVAAWLGFWGKDASFSVLIKRKNGLLQSLALDVSN